MNLRFFQKVDFPSFLETLVDEKTMQIYGKSVWSFFVVWLSELPSTISS